MSEGQAVALRRQTIPAALAEVGVQIAEDPESGMQIIVIPPALRQRANVLMPVQAFQQADPSWTPSIRLVQADPDDKNGTHFYPQQGGKKAPKKQLLELLADAAGVISTRTVLLDRERVEVGGVIAETFTHRATLQIRKSDGTLRTIEDSKTYEPYAEYEEICTAVTSGQYAKSGAEAVAEIRKRWLNEIKFAKAKNESKAILRTIRSALQIPHTFSAEDVKKPFLVIGWNFTPDLSDVETRRMLIAAGLFGGSSASERMFGAPADTPRAIEAPPADDPEPQPAAPEVEVSAAPEPETTVEPEPAKLPEPEPTLEDDEPIAFTVPEGVADDPAVKAAQEASGAEIPTGSFKGMTLAAFHSEKGDRAVSWFRWALRNWTDEPFKTQLWAYAGVYLPELVEQVQAELSAAA